MSRTTRYKLLYVAVLALMIAGIGTWVLVRRPPTWALIVVGVLLLIPGRVAGHYWRDFFRGRVLFRRQPAASIPYFERFLETIQQRPRLKHLIWLMWGVYTRDVDVMTRNNLGAAYLQTGDLEQAQSYLESAVTLDPEAPLPYFNLALVAHLQGDSHWAAECLKTARNLGFKRAISDKLVTGAGEILAQIEGRPLRREG